MSFIKYREGAKESRPQKYFPLQLEMCRENMTSWYTLSIHLRVRNAW